MRIISVRKGLEIDSSETDYMYEAYYEWLYENNHFLIFFTNLKYYFDEYCENWDEDLASDLKKGVNQVLKIINDRNIDLEVFWNGFENNFWSEYEDFNKAYFLSALESESSSINVYHSYSNILDFFKTENSLLLFSGKIGITFPDILHMNYPIIVKIDKEEITINNPEECTAFLLFMSHLMYEESTFEENLMYITILPKNWDENKFFIINSLEEFKLISEDKLNIVILKEGVKKQLIDLNKKLMGNVSLFNIINYLDSISLKYPKTVNFFFEWIKSLDEFSDSEIEIFIKRINDGVDRIVDIINTVGNQEINSLNEKRRRDQLKLQLKLKNNPFYFFLQLRKMEEMDDLLKKLDKFFYKDITSLSRFAKDSIIKRLGERISNILSNHSQVEDAIVFAINSGAFLTAADLYEKIGMKKQSLGLKYRHCKGIEPKISKLLDTDNIKAIPVVIDLFPCSKKSVVIAMIQLNLEEDYLEKMENKNHFFITKEEEEKIYSIISKALKAIEDKNIDFVIFPELAISFSPNSKYYFNKIGSPLRKILQENAFIKKRIIIPGTFYLNSRNVAPIILPTMEINYVSKQSLSKEEDSPIPEMAVKKGKITPVFHTNYGNFAVLICRDLLNGDLLQSVLNLKPDIIFNPCANKDINRFNKESNVIVQNNEIFIIQPNLFFNEDIENSSSIYSILHKDHIRNLEVMGYKKTKEPYEVYSSIKKKNEIVLVQLDLMTKRILIPSIGSDSSNVPIKILEVLDINDNGE